MSSLRRVELLVLDEIGYITLHKEASELLFQIVSDCYEQKRPHHYVQSGIFPVERGVR
jgi:DNA replication protein DnaC